ncbi:hypothetical protein HETIRDRAFT_307777 [Heterobasidion irregulare TC 32-1]|uniref:C2H2-type domain-containing protein n=1 Tax=Heterobasidion irregulare (strain TC 32-1) TaxID=747525 RepID=W4KME5_HETIT|nr:uncharacterized protein HETIRDRAFT_307777 [Heterobasidion irregulare TC 32-1]ETW86550.1 hypothetical protein HETIRDRAFT_307777 [Heterobasidion irregulare TC 32-1]
MVPKSASIFARSSRANVPKMPPQRHKHQPYRLQCPDCPKEFRNMSGLTQHRNSAHIRLPSASLSPPPTERLPSPELADLAAPLEVPMEDIAEPPRGAHRIYHRDINALPCDIHGHNLPPGTPPPPRHEQDGVDKDNDWFPFHDRLEFETGEFLFRRQHMSNNGIDELMDLWAASLLKHHAEPPFSSHGDLDSVLDSIKVGNVPWQSFHVSYTGQLPNAAVTPPWMLDKYDVWFRSPHVLFRNMISNPDFEGDVDYCPYQEFDKNGERIWKNLMGADFAFEQCNTIAEDPTNHGSMFVPIILGSDKTTVSVATGQNEYYPLYGSIGNVHNHVRRAHRNALVLIGFLAVPKTERKYSNSALFRKFRRQLFHSSLSAILQCLKLAMTTPEVTRCWDGHYRRVIYGLGPYIADYPEQVLLACIVQGWCPICTTPAKELDGPLQIPRSREHTELLVDLLTPRVLWDDYGIVADLIPFTNDFPRADIHQLISPDLLHQIIKGCWKDHLVTWVCDYLILTHGKTRGHEIMDDIDRRIEAVPTFSGLRHFHQGRDFKQWTGDDSKALMKVYLPAIAGHVPQQMVKTLAAFLEVCYLVRRDEIDRATLAQIEDALARFRQHRQIFKATGVRDDFCLPRQHALEHYVRHIQRFGAPNGLCLSITESKHIKAVKEPWRSSNRNNPLGQMLLANQRLDKLAAARVDFHSRGMLFGTCLDAAYAEFIQLNEAEAGLDNANEDHENADEDHEDVNEDHEDADEGHEDLDEGCGAANEGCEDADEGDEDVGAVAGHTVENYVVLAKKRQPGYAQTLDALGIHIGHPRLLELTRQFLFEQLHPNGPPASTIALNLCPIVTDRRVSVYHSATAIFYAPSDPSGIGGMRREVIRATPSWRHGPSRYDCVYLQMDAEHQGFRGLNAVRVRLFFRFRFHGRTYPCALVEWFSAIGDDPDEDTGMWIVEPDLDIDGNHATSVIHLESIVRAAHLIPVYGEEFLPPHAVDPSSALDAYAAYFVNKFVDHHAHWLAF